MEFLHNSIIVIDTIDPGPTHTFQLYRVQIKAVILYWALFVPWFPLCRSEAGLVTPKYGYLSAAAVISRMMMIELN